MAKISEYGNYETDKSQSEVENFKATGLLPVSGKYTDNDDMITKNVKLSDLVGGYNKPEDGIPADDLATDVQSALAKANNALTKIDASRGLKADDDGVYVDIVEYDGGLAFTDTGALKIKYSSARGIEVTNDGIGVNIASDGGLACTDAGALKLNIASDGGLECTGSGVLRIQHQIPDPSGKTNGQVLTISSDELVWADVPSQIPAYTSDDAGKVLAVNSDGTGLIWISNGSGGSAG